MCKQARLSEDNLWELLSRWHGRAASTLPPWHRVGRRGQLNPSWSVFILPQMHTAFPALGPHLMIFYFLY